MLNIPLLSNHKRIHSDGQIYINIQCVQYFTTQIAVIRGRKHAYKLLAGAFLGNQWLLLSTTLSTLYLRLLPDYWLALYWYTCSSEHMPEYFWRNSQIFYTLLGEISLKVL